MCSYFLEEKKPGTPLDTVLSFLPPGFLLPGCILQLGQRGFRYDCTQPGTTLPSNACSGDQARAFPFNFWLFSLLLPSLPSDYSGASSSPAYVLHSCLLTDMERLDLLSHEASGLRPKEKLCLAVSQESLKIWNH